ncbi:MAG: ATP-grasp domain-containing protein [Acidobacteriia bacterium]|nr:ATP-grasp domain-containing protein [Terriglobia bacterium]
MRAVLLVDESLFVPEDPNFTKQPKKPWEAEFSVSHALRHLGHNVVGIPATLDVAKTIELIKAARPDFVFNLVEEIEGRRKYDSLLVRIMELMGIPYTGASADALMLSRNKHLAKLVVAGAGVPVPEGVVISRGMKYPLTSLKFPLIVKPLHGDGSEGINAKSYVKGPAVLDRRLRQLMQRSSQPILCEEYIPGREIIVTVSGVKKIFIDSICELVFPRKSQIKFATELAKFDQRYRARSGIFYRTPTRLPDWLTAKVIDFAKKAYQALEIEAYAKVEFRVNGDKVIFIEANPNSQLSRFAHSTDFASIGYEAFIKRIVRMAFERRGR